MTAPILARRSFITGLISLVAAPAIVRAGSLMPVRAMLIEAPDVVYGQSPAMTALPSLIDLNAAIREMLQIMAIPPQYVKNL